MASLAALALQCQLSQSEPANGTPRRQKQEPLLKMSSNLKCALEINELMYFFMWIVEKVDMI